MVNNYDMCTPWGITQDRVEILVREFTLSPEFRCLPPVYGAMQGIKELRAAGWKITGVTACHDTPSTRMMRRENLEYVFGRNTISNVIFVGLHGSKKEIFSDYNDAVVVEDSHRHALAALETGHRVVFFPHYYDGEIDSRLRVVNNWKEITEVLQHREMTVV
jgi:beta-phosphoglucomutase-like phosphatase (HAD superfamily)